jgi:hypothetical protein
MGDMGDGFPTSTGDLPDPAFGRGVPQGAEIFRE